MERSNFKVVIVGGSIAGLTLAHCLAKAGIDHVVLEKRTDIAPQEGAFVGVWPNGARVLQQLGVYPHLETLAEPLSQMHVTFPDGFAFRSLLPKAVHEKLGFNNKLRRDDEVANELILDLTILSFPCVDKKFSKYYINVIPRKKISLLEKESQKYGS